MVRLGRDNEYMRSEGERILSRPRYRLSKGYTNDWYQLCRMAELQADAGVIEDGIYTCINTALRFGVALPFGACVWEA